MKFIVLILMMTLSTLAHAQSTGEAQELKPFATDYCSKWPEGEKQDPSQWADCCFTHDLHYWVGGTEDERKSADKELKSCVKLSGASIVSFIMYMGVRMGGKPGDADYAWGFGWKQSRGYDVIPPADIQTAKTMLENSEYYQDEKSKPLITQFIDDVLSLRLSEQ